MIIIPEIRSVDNYLVIGHNKKRIDIDAKDLQMVMIINDGGKIKMQYSLIKNSHLRLGLIDDYQPEPTACNCNKEDNNNGDITGSEIFGIENGLVMLRIHNGEIIDTIQMDDDHG